MDIKLLQNPNDFLFNVLFEKDEFLSDKGMETMVTISLFSDARITELELPAGETYRGGWWGEAAVALEPEAFGSKLWLLDREKQLPELLVRVEEWVLRALDWMIEEGIAQSISAEATYPRDEFMRIDIEIVRPEQERLSFNYDFLWEGQFNGI